MPTLNSTLVIKPKASSAQVKLIESICKYIDETNSSPSLTELAKKFQLSPYYLQRLFKNIVGISPKQYAEQSRQQRFKKQLRSQNLVTTALYESGYNSSATLYTKVKNKFGMTPKDYRSGGLSTTIFYSISNCTLGKILVASTNRGICMVTLADKEAPLINALHEEFPQAQILRSDKDLLGQINALLQYLTGQEPHCDLPLDVKGTAFQKRVWDELRRISYGTTCSYEQIAKRIGKPKAVRAVANACANNPTSLIVPCHRVIRKDGSLGSYRWDLKRKEALLKMEKASKGTD